MRLVFAPCSFSHRANEKFCRIGGTPLERQQIFESRVSTRGEVGSARASQDGCSRLGGRGRFQMKLFFANCRGKKVLSKVRQMTEITEGEMEECKKKKNKSLEGWIRERE